jgi:hypothetical protein
LRPTSIILEIVKELEDLKDKVRFVNEKEDEFVQLVKTLKNENRTVSYSLNQSLSLLVKRFKE